MLHHILPHPYHALNAGPGIMKRVVRITSLFAVTGALEAADFAEVAALGFKSVISNLPDGELPAYPASSEAAALAAKAGLGYRHIPVTKADVFSEAVVGGTVAALRELDGPVLAHCASGLRSAVAWAAAAVRGQSVDAVLGRLAAAGLNLEGLRGELQEQHDPGHISPIPPALDVTDA
jgi:sulfide:quinone oxidoreductase